MGLAALLATSVAFLLVSTRLVLDLTGVSRRGTAARVTFTGILLMSGAALARMIAQERVASHAWLLVIDGISLALTLTGAAVLLVGMFKLQGS